MRVQWTRRARDRLDRHIGQIALHCPRAAEETLDRILGCGGMLADHPLLGHEGRYLGTRELVVDGGRYSIVYRVRGQVVQIITIHDARQQWPDDWRQAYAAIQPLAN